MRKTINVPLRAKRSHLLKDCFVALLFVMTPWTAHADINDGLIGHWNFDETSGTVAADSSGNGNNGTLINGPTWVTGQVGSGALSLDGIDDKVSTAPMAVPNT